MQYDWLSWYYEMYDLYVIQDKTLPFVVEHFKKKGFTPRYVEFINPCNGKHFANFSFSARAFQVQFRVSDPTNSNPVSRGPCYSLRLKLMQIEMGVSTQESSR